MTLTTGARQLVVHEAAVTRWCSGRVVLVVVDAVDDVQGALGRRRDDHLLHALVEVGLQGLRLLVMRPGRLDHDVAARPVGVGDRGIAAVADRLAVDDHRVVRRAAGHRPGAVDRVELQQVGRAGRICRDLVDLHDRKACPAPARAQAEPAHAAEAVDSNLHAHGFHCSR
jgi:hypothetical protein